VNWCPLPDSNRHGRYRPMDVKSLDAQLINCGAGSKALGNPGTVLIAGLS